MDKKSAHYSTSAAHVYINNSDDSSWVSMKYEKVAIKVYSFPYSIPAAIMSMFIHVETNRN